ncbi:UNVERIFIED_CONTAM: hypothetical protein HDU68_012104, partial [Siphonaria sp. JEL0065]
MKPQAVVTAAIVIACSFMTITYYVILKAKPEHIEAPVIEDYDLILDGITEAVERTSQLPATTVASTAASAPSATNIPKSSNTTTIPRHLHQIWLGDASKRPSHFMDHCKAIHPNWTYTIHNDDSIKGMLSPKMQPIFESWRNYNLAGASDILRYAVLQKFGGVYVDADQQCLRPFDDLMNNKFDIFVAYESLGNVESNVPNATLIATGVIGASKDHPFINLIIDNIDLHGGAVGHGAGWAIVGPQLLTDVLPMYLEQQAKTEGGDGHEVKVLPYHTFWPYHHSEVPIPAGSDKHIRLNSYCVSWWGSTFDTYGKDWQEKIIVFGRLVRNHANEIFVLLGDNQKIKDKRKKAQENRRKYTGVSSSSGGFGGSGNKYGGFSGGGGGSSYHDDDYSSGNRGNLLEMQMMTRVTVL